MIAIRNYKPKLENITCPLCGEKHKAKDWVIFPLEVVCKHSIYNSNHLYLTEMPKWFSAGNSCGYAVEIPYNELKNQNNSFSINISLNVEVK